MAGINIAEVMARQKAKPDPIFELFLLRIRTARTLETINTLVMEAYEQLGDDDALREQVAAKLRE